LEREENEREGMSVTLTLEKSKMENEEEKAIEGESVKFSTRLKSLETFDRQVK
jgi:hypothetical protein